MLQSTLVLQETLITKCVDIVRILNQHPDTRVKSHTQFSWNKSNQSVD